MTDTARDIITEALLDLGVLAEDETPSAIQAAGALKKLNSMLDTWSIDDFLVYGMTQSILPLVSNKGVYTIGTGGDLNIPRPNEILSAYVRNVNLPASQRADYPIYIYNNQEWANVTFKSMTGAWPNYGIYFDWEYPLIKAYTNPIPTTTQYSIVFYTSGILSNVTLDQVLLFPPGYRDLIVSNLSIRLSPSYQVEVPEAIALLARQSMQLISNKNLQINELQVSSSGYRYNILSNRYKYPNGVY